MNTTELETVVQGELADGESILFRPIDKSDREGLRDGFERMSPDSRYRRFFSPIEHLTEELLDYLTDIDYENHFAWLAVLPDQPGSPGVGVGRWVRSETEPAAAEAAVVVLDDHQHRGIARALLRLMAESAVRRGINRFTMTVLGENDSMMRLMSGVGAVHDGIEGGLARMHVPLPESIEELYQTPAPAILRETAAGRFLGTAGPRATGTHLRAGEGANS